MPIHTKKHHRKYKIKPKPDILCSLSVVPLLFVSSSDTFQKASKRQNKPPKP